MDETTNNDKTETDKIRKIRNVADLQRLKLEKLMKNPEKPVIIPERPKPKNVPAVPDFVRNVMGSSAGAGSGEFHVYRHLRRKEYARQKFIQELSEKDKLEIQYREKVEQNVKDAQERTAKKRAKRLKKKQNQKNRSKKANTETPSVKTSSSDEDDNNGHIE